MAKYLVTGAAGFIGSHLVEEILKKGDQVKALDNLSTGKMSNIEPYLNDIEFIEGDIRDFETCKKAVSGVDYVLHQAALGSVPRSIEDPMTSNDVNVNGTLNMLVASRDEGVKSFVFASSSSIYGNNPVLPKVETMKPLPLSPYALTKFTGETYCGQFYKLYGLPTVALRYFNVYGPRQDPDSQYAAVIPKFSSALASGEAPTIFGDGEQARDFTFVKDVVRVNLAAAQSQEKAWGLFYNIAGGQKISINELFTRIKDIVKDKKSEAAAIDAIYAPPRAGDVKESLADIDQCVSLLEVKPQVGFDEGLKITVKSFLE